MPPLRSAKNAWGKFKRKTRKGRAGNEHAAQVVGQPPIHELTDIQKLQYGRLLVSLILESAKASNINDLAQIQFNFCLLNSEGKPLLTPASREIIRDCIRDYLVHGTPENDLSHDEISKMSVNLKAITENLPPNPVSLHDYVETLTLRADSFYKAALLILANDNGLIPIEVIDTITNIKHAFEEALHNATTPQMQQACYDGYMQIITEKLAHATGMNNEEMTKNLKETETMHNITKRKSHVTISGKIDTTSDILHGENIHLQIDEPRNRFCDLSQKQQEAWRAIYTESTNQNPEYPKWFENRSKIEKKIWLERMKDVVTNDNGNVCMGPVVKKQGVPGLRNLMLSSFATITVDADGSVHTKSMSAKSVRSSNLLGQAKDGKREMNEDEVQITQQNIQQITDLYRNNDMRTTTGGFSYAEPERIPFILCQTLVRKIGGGDDNVIKHKTAAIAAANQTNNNQRIFGSNHCIGTPAKVSKAFHLAMHLAGANTIGMNHIIDPVREFMENAVINSINDQPELVKQGLRNLYQDALRGEISGALQDISNTYDIPPDTFSPEQMKTLNRALEATNMYAKETGKPSSFNKTHQLHLAALENIIYEDTGNCIQSSCKSGKDREGILKNYRNAIRAFYDEFGRLPPSSSKDESQPGDREKFVNIFVELFKTHHQARLAELNAAGCQGQKALSNILPKDIMKQLKNDPEGQALLKTHKQNSALNDIGHSAVKADPVELERVKDTYSPKSANDPLQLR